MDQGKTWPHGDESVEGIINTVFFESKPLMLSNIMGKEPGGIRLNEKQFRRSLVEVLQRYKHLMNKPGQQATNPKTMEEKGEAPELTFGEKLVGKTFNPSGDDKVARLKALAAEMADIVNSHEGTNTYIGNLIKGNALREILNGQMNAVKFITNNH